MKENSDQTDYPEYYREVSQFLKAEDEQQPNYLDIPGRSTEERMEIIIKL